MNKKALKMLLTRLEHIDEGLWDMRTSAEPCGCFIEHTCQVLGLHRKAEPEFLFSDSKALTCRAKLGLSMTVFNKLCVPLYPELAGWACSDPANPDFVSLDRAIKVLRNLIETGEVDWRIR